MEPPAYLAPSGDGVVIAVVVQPRAARTALVGIQGAALKLKVTDPPVDDRANRAVEALLAEVLSVPKSAVEVVAGRTSRHKRVAVSGVDPGAAAGALERLLH